MGIRFKQYDVEYDKRVGHKLRCSNITKSTGSLYYIRHIPKHMTLAICVIKGGGEQKTKAHTIRTC